MGPRPHAEGLAEALAAVLARAGALADRVVRRFMPDPFALVLGLTLVALALGLATMPDAPGDGGGSLLGKGSALLDEWTRGFGDPEILKFGLQIILIVVTGEAIAASPPARRGLAWLTAVPKTAGQALFLVTSYALVTGWVHWGFGLVSSALLAREVGRTLKARGVAVHYPLLGTGAYTSMLLWHAGLTASAPLLMNTDVNFVSKMLEAQAGGPGGAGGIGGPGGVGSGRVPLSETIFAPYNLIACALLVVLIPPLIVLLQPKTATPLDPALVPSPPADPAPPVPGDARTPAEALDRSRVLTFAVGALGLLFLKRYVREHGFDLNHNVVNVTFLMLGMTLHESPISYAAAIGKATRGVSGVVLQFPFYGGLLHVMSFTGLSGRIAHLFIEASTAQTLPVFAFFASILTKSFVPSGAGEWAVEGPPMLKAAHALGVGYGKVTMGVAYGNMLGNMYQPFWSLPLLGLMGLTAKDIMGYSLVLFCVCLPILSLALLFG